jgi:hypothetical protein
MTGIEKICPAPPSIKGQFERVTYHIGVIVVAVLDIDVVDIPVIRLLLGPAWTGTGIGKFP